MWQTQQRFDVPNVASTCCLLIVLVSRQRVPGYTATVAANSCTFIAGLVLVQCKCFQSHNFKHDKTSDVKFHTITILFLNCEKPNICSTFLVRAVDHHEEQPFWHVMILWSYLCVCGLHDERHSQERSRVFSTACHVSLDTALWFRFCLLRCCKPVAFGTDSAHPCLPGRKVIEHHISCHFAKKVANRKTSKGIVSSTFSDCSTKTFFETKLKKNNFFTIKISRTFVSKLDTSSFLACSLKTLTMDLT